MLLRSITWLLFVMAMSPYVYAQKAETEVISVGEGAEEIRLLVPTPTERVEERRPIYIECRAGKLFRIPVTELRKAVREKISYILETFSADRGAQIRALNDTVVQIDTYEAGLSMALAGKFSARPRRSDQGYMLGGDDLSSKTNWFHAVLDRADADKDRIFFIVSEDSISIFEHALDLAAIKAIEVTYEFIDERNRTTFNLSEELLVAPGMRMPEIERNHLAASGKTAVHINVAKDALTIYRTDEGGNASFEVVRIADLGKPENAFVRLLDEIEQEIDTKYIMLLMRPGTAQVNRRLHKLIRSRGIDVDHELYRTGRIFNP